MKTARALTLAAWFVMVAALCLVPVQPRVQSAPRADCEVPAVAFNGAGDSSTGLVTGSFTGLEHDVAVSCRENSGLRLAATSLVGGGGLAGGLVLLRGTPKARRRDASGAGRPATDARGGSGRDPRPVP